MREFGPSASRADENLAASAFLYVSGELDEADAADFERRLADDQTARDALCRAVELNDELQGVLAFKPRASVRERVRARLLPRRGLWSRLTGRQTHDGHPIAWCLVGAAAAIMVMSVSQPIITPTIADRTPAPVASRPAPPVQQEDVAFDVDAAVRAVVWSELHDGGHVSRAHDDEHRRRERMDERRAPRPDLRPNRLFGPSRMTQ